MNSQPNDVSPEAMQARIQQARREAETLKDRIKRKKDELADTTRMLFLSLSAVSIGGFFFFSPIFAMLTRCFFQSGLSLSRLTSPSPRTSSCGRSGRSRAIWPRSTPCTGLQTADTSSQPRRTESSSSGTPTPPTKSTPSPSAHHGS